MGAIRRFEDIEAWQDAKLLAGHVYKMTDSWKDFSLKDQMRRASVSIMANIAEGFARKGNKEFVHFMYISKASASELQSHLYLALDLLYVSRDEFDSMYEQTDKTQRKLTNFIKMLR